MSGSRIESQPRYDRRKLFKTFGVIAGLAALDNTFPATTAQSSSIDSSGAFSTHKGPALFLPTNYNKLSVATAPDICGPINGLTEKKCDPEIAPSPDCILEIAFAFPVMTLERSGFVPGRKIHFGISEDPGYPYSGPAPLLVAMLESRADGIGYAEEAIDPETRNPFVLPKENGDLSYKYIKTSLGIPLLIVTQKGSSRLRVKDFDRSINDWNDDLNGIRASATRLNSDRRPHINAQGRVERMTENVAYCNPCFVPMEIKLMGFYQKISDYKGNDLVLKDLDPRTIPNQASVQFRGWD